MTVGDRSFAVSDNLWVMTDLSREYVHERSVIALVEAAKAIDISVDTDTLMPTRHYRGNDALVPANEHLAVAKVIFSDPRETLGIELAQALPLESTGFWGFLLRSSITFEGMLRRAERYIRIVNRFREFDLEERQNGLAMVCPFPRESPLGRREQVVCAFLGHWIAWGRQLTRQPFAVDARFRWSGLQDQSPFVAFFGGTVTFGADEDALILSQDVLSLPLPEGTPELAEQFEAYAKALVQRIQPEASFVEQVRNALLEGLLIGKDTEKDIAHSLAMTSRTLHRHLAEAGTSFRELLNDLRLQRAQVLLQDSGVSIAEIAYLVGYAEPSSFHRAFRRWTGLTPIEWKEQSGYSVRTLPLGNRNF